MHATNIVANRTLCIGLIALRAQAENGIAHVEGQTDHFLQFGTELTQWADTYGVSESLAATERELHNRPLGKWEFTEIFENFWRVEALKGLLWTIGHLPDMPSYFDVGNPNDAYSLICFDRPTTAFMESSQLRDETVIKAQRQLAFFLNWRCRTETLRLQGVEAPMGDSYDALVQRSLDGIEEEGLRLDHDGIDILIDGCRFIDLEDDSKSSIGSICCERHLALEWIFAPDEDWDSVRAHT
jgi:hypothetical protein